MSENTTKAKRESLSLFRMEYPAAAGAFYVIDGKDAGYCPRCGDAVTVEAPAAAYEPQANESAWRRIMRAPFAEGTYPAVPCVYGAAAPALADILELSHRLQSWRPDALTLELYARLSEPFCLACADWHEVGETHSATTETK